MDSLVGITVDGKYRIESILGSGGLGTVYKARQAELNRSVALKFLHCTASVDPEMRARFDREARILATLQHENVVSIYSFGVYAQTMPYLAMEYLQGRTLADLLDEKESLDWRQVADIGIQICRGLSAAHNAGIVHRDLKPQNIMLVNNQTVVKILDFGLSGLIDDPSRASQKLTQTGALIGSIHYMSPEVCSGQRADGRADIYAAGCILYQCLAGRLPLDAENPIAMLHKHKAEMPPPLPKDSQNLPIPPALELVIFKAIQKNANDRFGSISEMADALELIKQGRGDELSIKNVRTGARKKKLSLILTIAGTVLLFACIGLVAVKIANPAEVAEHGEQPKLSIIEERRAQQRTAKKLLTKLDDAKAAGRSNEVARIAKRILEIIGRKYPKEARTEKLAQEDIAILDHLAEICRGTPFPRPQGGDSFVVSALTVFDSQNKYLLPHRNGAQLLAVKARILTDFTDWRSGVHSCYRALREAHYSDDIDSCRNLYLMMQENTARSSDRKAQFWLMMAKAQYLCATGAYEQAATTLEECTRGTYSQEAEVERVDTLEDIYCMQQIRKDNKASADALDRLEPLLVKLTAGSLNEAFEKRNTDEENYRKATKILGNMKKRTSPSALQLRARIEKTLTEFETQWNAKLARRAGAVISDGHPK